MEVRKSTFNQNSCIGRFVGLKAWLANLTFDEAHAMVASIKELTADRDTLYDILSARGATKWEQKTSVTKTTTNWQALYDKAHAAGLEAGQAVTPTPMTVVQRANPLDDNSPVVKAYEPVADGVCGFAGVRFPGNTSWGKWCKANKIARKGYPTGLHISCHAFNQSLTRKTAYATAFAKVLTEAGIEKVYVESRMD